MDTIYIPHLLKIPQRTRELTLNDLIAGLETLTPVRGRMRIRHGGNFLEVVVKAEAIVTLSCDRCLGHYNYRLGLDTSELIWLAKNESPHNFPQEREISWDDLSETLPPDGHFNPETWLYEQLSLALPFRKICSNNCQAPHFPSADNPINSLSDRRWANLANLQQHLEC